MVLEDPAANELFGIVVSKKHFSFNKNILVQEKSIRSLGNQNCTI